MRQPLLLLLTNNFTYKEEDFMNKKIKTLFSYLMIIVGAILASFSVACILLPNDAIDYGTAGIAIIISKLTGYNLSLCVLLVFLPFLIAGVSFLSVSISLQKRSWALLSTQ